MMEDSGGMMGPAVRRDLLQRICSRCSRAWSIYSFGRDAHGEAHNNLRGVFLSVF